MGQGVIQTDSLESYTFVIAPDKDSLALHLFIASPARDRDTWRCPSANLAQGADCIRGQYPSSTMHRDSTPLMKPLVIW